MRLVECASHTHETAGQPASLPPTAGRGTKGCQALVTASKYQLPPNICWASQRVCLSVCRSVFMHACVSVRLPARPPTPNLRPWGERGVPLPLTRCYVAPFLENEVFWKQMRASPSPMEQEERDFNCSSVFAKGCRRQRASRALNRTPRERSITHSCHMREAV